MDSLEKLLPAELWDFLVQGCQLAYDPEETEAGCVTLHTAGSLRIGRVYVAPCADDDPNRGASGVYRIPAISLIGECERYEPEHLLTYLPFEQVFAAFDGDHAVMTVFPGASWSDIVAAPARYLNALWQPEPEVTVARDGVWWKRYAFFKDAFE